MKAYKYIIRNNGSKRDINGNCYWYGVLINLNTRESITLYEEYEGEISYLLRTEHNINCLEIYEYTVMIPVRQWNTYIKHLEFDKDHKGNIIHPEFMAYGNTRKNYINSVL